MYQNMYQADFAPILVQKKQKSQARHGLYLQGFKEHLAGQIYAPRQRRQAGAVYRLRKERRGVREEAGGDDRKAEKQWNNNRIIFMYADVSAS